MSTDGSFSLLRSTRGTRVLALRPLSSQNDSIAVIFTPARHVGSTCSSLAVSVVPVDVVDSYAFKPLSTSSFYGALGVIRVQHVITGCTPAGSLDGHVVFKINDVEFYSLEDDRFDRHIRKESAVYYDGELQDVSQSLTHPCAQIAQHISSCTFYFSRTLDLSRTFQNSSRNGAPLSWAEIRSDFFWNKFMMKPIMSFAQQLSSSRKAQLESSAIFVVAINGYFGFRLFSDLGHISLISRLSCQRVGARLISRGLDDDGNTSNFVESEIIVQLGTTFCSYIIVRGSVPVFWDQQGQRLGYPKVQLTRTPIATQPAFDRHIRSLSENYGLLHAVDLLDQREGKSEYVLSHALEYHCKKYVDKNTLSLTKFDMNSIIKVFDYHRLEALFHLISRDIQIFGYYVKEGSRVIKEQKGVFRINCLDCLDRTNVVQSFIGFKALELFFRITCGQNMPAECLEFCRELWAENGDQLSLIYSGTGAQRSVFTKSGKYGISDVFSDVKKTFARLYQSNFKDRDKQDIIDLLLGKQTTQEVIELYDPLAAKIKKEMDLCADWFSKSMSLSITCLTWNTGGIVPGSNELIDELVTFENVKSGISSDILVFGLQEIVTLNATQIVSSDPERKLLWENAILSSISRKYGADEYTLLASNQLVGMAVLVFVRGSLIASIRNVEFAYKKTGLGGMAGNKGSIALRLDLYDSSFCFICSHFTAVIWFGDLNYRNDMEYLMAKRLIEANEITELASYDQLSRRAKEGLVFPGFLEGPISFKPTYKYDPGTSTYDTSEKMRVPSWTDRVLYLYKDDDLGTTVSAYNDIDICSSDHKPVFCTIKTYAKSIYREKMRKMEAELYAKHTNLIEFADEDAPPPLPPRPLVEL